MKLIHLCYQQPQEDFYNDGALLLWIESSEKISGEGVYPYQLSQDEFFNVLDKPLFQAVSTDPLGAEIDVLLPCNQAGHPLPSPVICQALDMSDTVVTSWQHFTLFTVDIDNVLAGLQKLSHLCNTLPEDMCLADDALFWMKAGSMILEQIRLNQYLPTMSVRQRNEHVACFTKWQLAPHFEGVLAGLASGMPASARLADRTVDPLSLLRHFSQHSLNDFLWGMSLPVQFKKSIEDTFLEPLLTGYGTIPELEYRAWLTWWNNLKYDLEGAGCDLMIRLHGASDDRGHDWALEVLIQSRHEPSYVVPVDTYFATAQEKSSLYSKMFGQSINKHVLTQLHLAGKIYPVLNGVLHMDFKTATLPIDMEAAYRFLKVDAVNLQESGFSISLPAWWTAQGRLKAKVKMRASASSTAVSASSSGYFDASSIAAFDYRLALGQHEVDPDQWQALLDARSDLVYFRGQWVEVDAEAMRAVEKLIARDQVERPSGSIKDLLLIAADDETYDTEGDEDITTVLAQLGTKDGIEDMKQPEALQAVLRPYQLRGLSWLSYLEDLGLNPCLADDMGLGKTMQVIALLLAKPRPQATLIVAPTSVVGNWRKEIDKFAPSLKVLVHHGTDRISEQALREEVDQYDVVITSYGLVRRYKKLFSEIAWSRLILDEAHNIKNPLAAQTKAVCLIPATSRIALTGTPVENRLLDLWSLFHFLNPGYLGSQKPFRQRFERPIQKDHCPQQSKLLKRLVEPFILRRLKTDEEIMADLPDKIEQKVYCELTEEQASIYQTIVDETTKNLGETDDTNKQRVLMITTLLKLKQCCNHPAQVLQDGSEFSAPRSIKLQRLLEMVSEMMEHQESVLIFSQFTEVCASLHKILEKEGYLTYYLHGKTSPQRRQQMIEAFQAEDAKPGVFILSLKAGGVGITLTRANHVIHFDRWWNPAVENQATDRAYRIGQKKTVFAYKYITLGTIEESIDSMLTDKQKVADAVVGHDESWLSTLDPQSFIDLIKLSRNT